MELGFNLKVVIWFQIYFPILYIIFSPPWIFGKPIEVAWEFQELLIQESSSDPAIILKIPEQRKILPNLNASPLISGSWNSHRQYHQTGESESASSLAAKVHLIWPSSTLATVFLHYPDTDLQTWDSDIQRRIAKVKVYNMRKSLAIEINGLYDLGYLLQILKNMILYLIFPSLHPSLPLSLLLLLPAFLAQNAIQK